MITSGLTEKRMKNKRFCKTEKAIFLAYYKLRDYPNAKKLAKTANISRSTLYKHHKKIQAIPADYEDFLLQNYAKAIKKYLKKPAEFKTILFRTHAFIFANREIFGALFKEGHKETIKKMFNILKPNVLNEWGLTGNLDKIYNIYTNEILGIIESWEKQNFSEKSLEQVLNDTLYLTKTSKQKLLPLK